jgi:class 3 adenylate cyclase
MGTRTQTVVFTDLSGYTASVGRQDRQGVRELVASHEQIVVPVLEKRGGRVVKNLGDSFMVLFDAATDGVRACVDLVESLGDGHRFTIRAGIATGDVELIDGDAFGEAVNLAARILGKAPGGAVWMGPATHLCMNQAEVPWEPVAVMDFKGIAQAVNVYRAVPENTCWLPLAVREAIRGGSLIRWERGDPPPPCPPGSRVLLERFGPGTASLREAMALLPVLEPGSVYLATRHIAPSDRADWEGRGLGLVIAAPAALEAAVVRERRTQTIVGSSDTIIFEQESGAVLDLVLAGVALPQVPISDVVAGYTYDLMSDGRWLSRSTDAVARIDVSVDGVQLIPLAAGVLVDGKAGRIGEEILLSDGARVTTDKVTIVYRDLAGDDGPYVGMLVADGPRRLPVGMGQSVEIGREPAAPGLALPDRPGQGNIRWCMGGRAAKAREGGFTLDRALAGRRHAALKVGLSGPELEGIHDRCPTYVVREAGIEVVTGAVPARLDDLFVMGTSVISIREPGT